MLYIVRFINVHGNEVSLSGPAQSVFNLISALDVSPYVEGWKIEGYSPSDFGWAPDIEWNKIVRSFHDG